MYPPIDPSTIQEDDRLDILEVLRLGNTLSKAPLKPKGVLHGITAAYMRHQAAPYAYSYRGKLRAAYWPYREACEKGQDKPILSPERGDVYQRAQKEFLAERDGRTGKFIPRNPAVAPIMNEFSLAQGLASAILNEKNEFNLSKITGKEIGAVKLGPARKELLARTAEAVVSKAKGVNAQQQVAAIVRKNLDREVRRATKKKDAKIDLLEKNLQELTLPVSLS
ncbi:hypothetical protein VE02_02052 [Pseudogymnoascus sp. 03VT05]|nr:hypothetical protein VE02_02052 [Pseudogymnoascus sp. 03VT05]